MFKQLKRVISGGFWQLLAMLIVLAVAGPEIMISMELMTIVELLGASSFVIAYLSGCKLFIKKHVDKLARFESHSFFFIPPIHILKQMPSIALHAIPERIFVISFLSFIVFGIGLLYWNLATNTLL
jgi:hypothetical protein